MEELLAPDAPASEAAPIDLEGTQLRAVLEAIVYVAEEPLTLAQMAAALGQPPERVREVLDGLMSEFEKPEHGVSIREVAGGYKMATKPEHHEAVRNFVKSLKPPLKLSLPALETLAVIAYKQPVTAPEIMEIRGVQGAGVLKTLLDRKLISIAGRKDVIGKPHLYKTTKEFMIQFGLKDLSELPSLKEFEEIRRMAMADEPVPAGTEAEAAGPIEPAGAETAEAESTGGSAPTESPAPSDAGRAGTPEPADTAAAEPNPAAEPPVPSAAEAAESSAAEAPGPAGEGPPETGASGPTTIQPPGPDSPPQDS
jgi:segregation and condensation protein B